MPRQRFKIPSYRLHKARGLAVVTLDGKDEYLGPYNSEESKAEYNRLIKDWLTKQQSGPEVFTPSGTEITIVEIIAKYLEHADRYYCHVDGTPTGELWNIKTAVKVLEELYCTAKAVEFGPLALNKVREKMIEKKWARKTINKQIGRIKAMFRWSVEQELIPASVFHGLATIRGLLRGRTTAIETDPVQPVAMQHVNAIKPYVSGQVWAMIQTQLFSGMRPGEITIMRGCDLEMEKGAVVWKYLPAKHKTEHHGKCRAISIGLKAQAIIEVARVILGHSSIATTEIYAEADLKQASTVMAEFG